MFPVACAHCILATKFVRSVCIQISLKWKKKTQIPEKKRKKSSKMTFSFNLVN